MANTYSQLYIHIVFSVKFRQKIIEKSWREELYKYICGIVNNKKQKVYAIGGVADHIHILISIDPSVSISDLVRDIKVNSTKWINDRNFSKKKFLWQEGFAAFSCGQRNLDQLIAYINNQEEHHQHVKFKKEYLEFLQHFEIEYEERYLFDDFDRLE